VDELGREEPASLPNMAIAEFKEPVPGAFSGMPTLAILFFAFGDRSGYVGFAH